MSKKDALNNESLGLRETGLGFKPGDIEKYVPLSEESIARELMDQELKKEMQKKQQGQNQQGGQGGQGSQAQAQLKKEQRTVLSMDNFPSTSDPSDTFNDDDNHLITPKTPSTRL